MAKSRVEDDNVEVKPTYTSSRRQKVPFTVIVDMNASGI